MKDGEGGGGGGGYVIWIPDTAKALLIWDVPDGVVVISGNGEGGIGVGETHLSLYLNKFGYDKDRRQ